MGTNLATITSIDGMDSREIAALTGKNHADVCRDIRKMSEDLEVDESKFASVYMGGNGEQRRCYILPKRECLILASGYNVRLRAAIIDRWAELEAKAGHTVPRSLADALQLAADQARAIEKQQAMLKAQAPAVEFVERFVEAKQTQPLRAVAKVLGVKERDFVQALIARHVLYRLDRKLIPHREVIDRGYFEVKEIVTADGFATTQMRFTTKGVEWAARKVSDWGLV